MANNRSIPSGAARGFFAKESFKPDELIQNHEAIERVLNCRCPIAALQQIAGSILIGSEDGSLNLFDIVSQTGKKLVSPHKEKILNIHFVSDNENSYYFIISANLVSLWDKDFDFKGKKETPNTKVKLLQNKQVAVIHNNQGACYSLSDYFDSDAKPSVEFKDYQVEDIESLSGDRKHLKLLERSGIVVPSNNTKLYNPDALVVSDGLILSNKVRSEKSCINTWVHCHKLLNLLNDTNSYFWGGDRFAVLPLSYGNCFAIITKSIVRQKAKLSEILESPRQSLFHDKSSSGTWHGKKHADVNDQIMELFIFNSKNQEICFLYAERFLFHQDVVQVNLLENGAFAFILGNKARIIPDKYKQRQELEHKQQKTRDHTAIATQVVKSKALPSNLANIVADYAMSEEASIFSCKS